MEKSIPPITDSFRCK